MYRFIFFCFLTVTISLHAEEELYHDKEVCRFTGCPNCSLSPDGHEDQLREQQPDRMENGEPYLQSPVIEETFIEEPAKSHYLKPDCSFLDEEGYTVNFEDISIIQLIHFISKISGTNYIFDSSQLQFNVTIVSEDPTSVEDLQAALLQVLKINNFSIVEEGNNVLIFRDSNVSKVATVITDENVNEACDLAIITRVFRLYNVDPTKVSAIVKPLLSPDAVVEFSEETRHLVVTDITANVNRITDLIAALDIPNAVFDIAEYRVKSAYPEALVAYAKEILLPLAVENPLHLISQPTAQKIFIVSTPYFIHKTLQVLESLDTADVTDVTDLPASSIANNNFYMYKLKYQDGEVIAQALREIGINLQYAGTANLDFVNTIYSIQWLEINNSIVITGTQDAINKVMELLDELDELPNQVFIEVLIIDTTLQNSLDFGVQWIALGEEQDKLAYASGLLSNVPPAPNLQGGTTENPGARFVAANPAATPPSIPNPGRDVSLPVPAQLAGNPALSNGAAAFGLGFIGNIIRHNGQSFLTLGSLISALDEEADTTVVLNPRIMSENNQTANFFVGQNIPYQTTSTVIQQTGSVTQNIQYEDVGVELTVTPTIAPDGMVTFQLDQIVEEVVTAIGDLTPTTNKTISSARLHVPDGTFLVMSGHIRDSANFIHSGIPCLGTLPLIGPAFSRTIEQRDKRNLIMFIRPKVITSIQQGLNLTNQEGYDFNWESNPCSIINCGPEQAPECETYPPPRCPTN